MKRLLPPLYAITDPSIAPDEGPARQAGRLLAAGVRLVQIRAKTLADDRLCAEACQAASAARATTGALLIVNDRPDIALVAGADGVHLGEEDLPAAAARAILGPGRIVGVSTHSGERALRAAEGPVDYVALGPIYPSTTKRTDRPLLGPQTVAWVRARTDKTLVAIGGITPERVAELVEAGADTLAVVAALLEGGDLASRVAAFDRRLRQAGRGGVGGSPV